MSFPRYPKYKDSGEQALGDVPAHWDVKPLRFVCSIRKGRLASDLRPSQPDEMYLPYLTMAYLRGESEAPAFVMPTSGLVQAREGDVLLLWDGSNAGEFLRAKEGVVSSTIALLEPNAVSKSFLYFACKSLEREMRDQSVGMGVPHVSGEYLRTRSVAVPPPVEETRIVSFIERESTRAADIITSQYQLIDLLKERRKALVSRAVTKGLGANVPMRPSGVQWIGDVPSHWGVVQLGRLCRVIADGPHFSPPYVSEGIPFLSARNVKVDGWDFSDLKHISRDLCSEFDKRVIPEIGDVLYTKGGTTGIARMVDLPYRFQVWVHIAVLKLQRDAVDPEFLAFALNSDGAYEQSQLYTRGATNQDLGLTRMTRICLALPPIDEQRCIAKVLRSQVALIDRQIEDCGRAAQLLRERSSAAIHAAVTGKIDLRNYAADEAGAA